MSIMGKGVWAVCCGALRNKFELYLTLAKLCDYRGQKLLDGIILSTWKGETECIDGFSEKLHELGIILVESEPLNEDVANYTDLNFARQACQLRRGMEVIPDDVFVLKCRTDYSIKRLVDVQAALEGELDFIVGKHGSMQFGLNYRIGVYRLNSNVMFHMYDQVFIGYKADIMQMTQIHMLRYRKHAFLAPDIAFFYNLFIDKYSVLDKWVSLFEVFKTIEGFYAYAESSGPEFELPSMLNKIWALYFILLNNCFCLFDSSRKCDPVKPFYLAEAFINKPAWKKGSEERFTCFINPHSIQMIVNGRCILTKGYVKLLTEIIQFMQIEYATNCIISKEEYDETYLWLKQVLKINPKKYMKEIINKGELYARKNLKFEEIMAFFTEDKIWIDNKEFCFVVKHYIQEKQGDNYVELAENFALFDKNLYMMETDFMASAGRTLKPWLLEELARRACEEEDTEVGTKIGFIFERWKGESRLYGFPMDSKKFAAIFKYSAFREQRCGVSENAKLLYIRLAKYYKKPLKDGIICYTDAIIEMIGVVINELYMDYKKNTDILNLVNFWIDERDINELSEVAKNFLIGYTIYRKVSLPFEEGQEEAVEKLIDLARRTETSQEAEAMLPRMLYERENVLSGWQRQIDEIIADWQEKRYIRSSVITRVWGGEYTIGKARIYLEAIQKEVSLLDNERFVLLCKMLYERQMLTEWEEFILPRCNTESKYLLVKVLKYLEKDKRLRFLCEKGDEVWVNLASSKYCNFEKAQYVLPRNNEGLLWPYAYKSSASPYAAFLKMTQKGLLVRIEFTAVTSLAKHYLAEVVKKNVFIDEQRTINRLTQVVYPIMDNDVFLENAICEACREIERIGNIVEQGYEEVILRMGKDTEFH